MNWIGNGVDEKCEEREERAARLMEYPRRCLRESVISTSCWNSFTYSLDDVALLLDMRDLFPSFSVYLSRLTTLNHNSYTRLRPLSKLVQSQKYTLSWLEE